MPGFDRITFTPNIMGGQACIRGMRIPVALIVNLVAYGKQPAEVVEEYPDLELDDIRQALAYAAWLASERVYRHGPEIAALNGYTQGIREDPSGGTADVQHHTFD